MERAKDLSAGQPLSQIHNVLRFSEGLPLDSVEYKNNAAIYYPPLIEWQVVDVVWDDTGMWDT